MFPVVEAEQLDVTEDSETTFDLVIGELEKEIPEHHGTVMGSDPLSCRAWYCC